MADRELIFRIGQVVPWPPAPMGMAQICDLRQTKLQLCYPFKNGRIARPVVAAATVAQLLRDIPLLFELFNVYNRGIVTREKAFEIPPAHRRRAA